MLGRYFVAMALVAAVITAPMAAWACGAPEQNVHVGQLMAVDTKAKSFTILDMQTASPITFVSDEQLITGLAGVKGIVQVLYRKDGDSLRAIDVRF